MPRDATTGACGWSDCGRLDRAAARRDEPGPETTRSGAHPSPLHDPRRPQEPRTRAEPSPLRRRGGRSAAARDQAAARGGGAVRRRQTPGARRPRAARGEDAQRVPPRRGRPRGDPAAIRAALAQVAELAALLLHDDAIRAEPVPDIGPPLELLAVAGSALEGVQLVVLTRALAGARLTAAELARLARDAPRTAALRVDPPPKEIETRLARSLDAEGVVLDAASRSLARARQGVREARQRLVARLDAMLGALDPTDR